MGQPTTSTSQVKPNIGSKQMLFSAPKIIAQPPKNFNFFIPKISTSSILNSKIKKGEVCTTIIKPQQTQSALEQVIMKKKELEMKRNILSIECDSRSERLKTFGVVKNENLFKTSSKVNISQNYGRYSQVMSSNQVSGIHEPQPTYDGHLFGVK